MLGSVPNIIIKPLVIFGAGASYDLISEKENKAFSQAEWRPPLSDNIFDSNNKFINDILISHPEVQGSKGVIIKKMNSGESLEDVLDEEQIQLGFEQDSIHLRTYLLRLFLAISRKCNKEVAGNNYQTFFKLLSRISTEFTVINFNYDFLAQKALKDVLHLNFDSIHSYIENPIKLIHIHGSILWDNGGGEMRVRDYEYGSGSPENIVLPVIHGKKFACPPEHITTLQEYIMREANVIIIIGWKGREEEFKKILSLFQNNPPKRIIVVSGEKNTFADGRGILLNCGFNKYQGIEKIFINGFSNFLNIYHDFMMKPLREHHF